MVVRRQKVSHIKKVNFITNDDEHLQDNATKKKRKHSYVVLAKMK
jgi:hypothetical protein